MSEKKKKKTEKPKRTDYMRGFLDGMERAASYGRQVEGDCGDVEYLIINDPDFRAYEDDYQ